MNDADKAKNNARRPSAAGTNEQFLPALPLEDMKRAPILPDGTRHCS